MLLMQRSNSSTETLRSSLSSASMYLTKLREIVDSMPSMSLLCVRPVCSDATACTGYSNRNDTGTHTQRTYMCCTLHHHTVCIMEVVYTTCPMKSSMQQQHYKVHSGICVHRTSSMKASMQQQQYKRGVSWNSCSPNLLKYQCIAISRIMQQSYRRQGPHSYLAEGMTKKSRISAILR
eukprot:scpid82980/ scgid6235/ 